MNAIDAALSSEAMAQFAAMKQRHRIHFANIVQERRNQEKKWGPQTHPDGTHAGYWGSRRDAARRICDGNAEFGMGTWLDILREEVFEAFAEEDPTKLRKELVQSAAVIVAWLEDLDRRHP